MPTGPSLTPYGRKLRSRYAQTANRHGRKAPETMEAARTYRAEKLAEHVRHVLATEPALTNDERQALAALLCSPVDRHDGEVSRLHDTPPCTGQCSGGVGIIIDLQ